MEFNKLQNGIEQIKNSDVIIVNDLPKITSKTKNIHKKIKNTDIDNFYIKKIFKNIKDKSILLNIDTTLKNYSLTRETKQGFITFTYDNNGIMKRMVAKSIKGEVNIDSYVEYDENDKEINLVFYDNDDYTISNFNKKHRILRRDFKKYNGDIEGYHVFLLDDKDNILVQNIIKENKLTTTYWSRDEKNRIVSITVTKYKEDMTLEESNTIMYQYIGDSIIPYKIASNTELYMVTNTNLSLVDYKVVDLLTNEEEDEKAHFDDLRLNENATVYDLGIFDENDNLVSLLYVKNLNDIKRKVCNISQEYDNKEKLPLSYFEIELDKKNRVKSLETISEGLVKFKYRKNTSTFKSIKKEIDKKLKQSHIEPQKYKPKDNIINFNKYKK